ncbi:MAG: LTA synthase family protein [Bacilli bacterium]|nr:LTA synthase family protein [Bacilli bacterium]
MKKETNKKSNILSKIKKQYNDLKDNPKEFLKQILQSIKQYLHENKLFFIFVFINVLNAFLLRLFTLGSTGNVFDIRTLLADFAFVTMLGSLSYLMRRKGKFSYLFIVTIILTAICTINSAYYTFYTSFSSISLLSTAKFITAVGDAVVENVLQPKDLIYIIMPCVLLYFHNHYKKNGYYEKVNFFSRSKKRFKNTLIVGLAAVALFATTLTGTDIGRLVKQWNREYIVMRFGIYTYHVNDLIKSIEPKVVALFGYDNALKQFKEYYTLEKPQIKNEYTNIFQGKNIIAIHAESIQNFVIGMKFNGIEVTPNLNKLAANGIYFDNFYTQVSVGTSSDTEFTLNTSLMPANIGTAFGNYFDKEYVSIPKLLKEKGYYTFAMHGNNADYWNRRVMHANLGYDRLYGKSDYNIDEVIGLGLSDVSFFKQSVEKLVEINKENEKFYGTFIMLTNHTPFSDTDKYGEFAVDIKEKVLNPETGLEEEVVYPYMEGTKLGNYLKSVHYADYALGIFFEELEKNGLLDNTVIVLYGDHDARLPEQDYVKLYNYDKLTNGILLEDDPNYVEFNEYNYELNRKVPLIIWSKTQKTVSGEEKKLTPQKISNVMGMYDVMPTLGNMFGFSNEYALGHDIFTIKENNIVVFPTGNWLTNKMYYNSQQDESYIINNAIISQEYITQNSEYADKLLSVSNDILVFDLIRNSKEETVNETDIIKGN